MEISGDFFCSHDGKMHLLSISNAIYFLLLGRSTWYYKVWSGKDEGKCPDACIRKSSSYIGFVYVMGGDSNDSGWGGLEYFLSEERGNVFDASSFATLRKPRRIG